MQQKEKVYLSLGSNLGDRWAYLRNALDALKKTDNIHLLRVSQVYETSPVGVTDQPFFLNLAAEIETVLEPLELLKTVKQVEVALGRKPREVWGPREVDIDIVLWGMRTISTDVLTIPHLAFRNRAFVLLPLSELAADKVEPVTGMTIASLTSLVDTSGCIVKQNLIYC